MRFRRVDVETCLDAHDRLQPKEIDLQGARHQVEEIFDRWYEGGSPGRPAVTYFKVGTKDGWTFILRHAAVFDAWAVLESAGIS